MLRKTITILDAEGNPAVGAHVMPDTGEKTITNAQGQAEVIVNDAEEWVTITYVGQENELPYNQLPATVKFGVNNLDEVVITAKKKSYAALWVLAAITLGTIAITNTNQPQKVVL